MQQSILYDITKLAVARLLGDGTRTRTQAFTSLASHYLFRDRFGRPGKGNDKGKGEGLVRNGRRRFRGCRRHRAMTSRTQGWKVIVGKNRIAVLAATRKRSASG